MSLGGGRTPDEFPGQRIEDSILFVSGSQYPISDGEVTYVSGVGFRFKEEGVVKGLFAPIPTAVGQILFAVGIDKFSHALPLTSLNAGVLINNNGYIIVSASL
jgi:hypothetical protein